MFVDVKMIVATVIDTSDAIQILPTNKRGQLLNPTRTNTNQP